MSINHLKIQNGLRLVPVTADPGDGQNGDMIYRSDLNKFRKYENGVWSDMSAAAVTAFSDAAFRVQDNADATKQIALEASAIATGTTRTISMPDANVDLGDIATAISDAGAAQADATQALSDAGTAQSAANAAQADATQALADAGNASIAASDAQADATQALADASSAQAKADAALPLAGGTMTGGIDMSGQTIINLSQIGGVPGEIGTGYANTVTGSTVSGANMIYDVSTLFDLTSVYVTAVYITEMGAPVRYSVNNVSFVSGNDYTIEVLNCSVDYLDITGFEVYRQIVNPILIDGLNLNLNKIINLGAPTANNDAATKKYVDDSISGISTGAVDNLVTLSGRPVNSTDLGAFTGGIISDNLTIKAALQEIEDAIEGIPDPISYQGTWNATTNSPALADTDTGVTGYLYQVVVAGTVDFGAGNISFEVGDKVVNNGSSWEKWDMTDAVTSVNGQSGAVSLALDDLSDVTAAAPSNGDVLSWNGAAWVNSVPAASGANTSLSNLTTTAINQDLLPGSGGLNLGSNANPWSTLTIAQMRLNTISGAISLNSDSVFIYGQLNSNGPRLAVAQYGIQKDAQGTSGSNFTRQEYYSNLTLGAGVSSFTTITSSDLYPIQTFAASSNQCVIVEYVVSNLVTGARRVGVLRATNNAGTVSFTDTFNETADVGSGFELRVSVGSGLYLIDYKNTDANGCLFTCEIKFYK